MRKKKIFFIVVIVVLVIAIAFGITGFVKKKRTSAQNTQQFTKTEAKQGNLSLNVSASGVVNSASTTQMLSDLSGTVSTINVEMGDMINEGDIIAVLDNSNIQDEIDKYQNNLQQQQNQLDKLEGQISDYYIKTPVSGRIKMLEARVGEDVGLTTKGYGALAVVSKQRKMLINIVTDVNVEEGEVVSVTVGGETFDGTISEVNIVQTQQPQQGTGDTENPTNPQQEANQQTNPQQEDEHQENPQDGQEDGQSLEDEEQINEQGESTEESEVEEEIIIESKIVVEIPRDNLKVDDEAVVYKSDSTLIGSGDLKLADFTSITGNKGVVSTIYVKENDMVSRGDNILKLKTTDLAISIDSQQLTIDDTTEQIDELREKLEETSIISDCNGVISKVSITEGMALQEGKPVASVIDIDNLELIVAVDELDVAKVAIGQSANIKVDALVDKVFEGEVVKIAHIGKSQSGVTTYDVTISIREPEGIKIGMNANADIEVEKKSNAVYIPIEALQDNNGEKFVYIEPDDSADESDNTKDNQKDESEDELIKDANNKQGSGALRQNMGSRLNNLSDQQREKLKSMSPEERQQMIAQYQEKAQAAQSVSSGQAQVQPVKIGIMNEYYVEIIEGLQKGDIVLIPSKAGSSNSTDSQAMRMPGGGFNRMMR